MALHGSCHYNFTLMRALILSLLFAAPLFAADLNPVHVDMVSAPAPKTAEKATVGVRFKIDPGWHIYWKYPGDAGLPTRVAFSTPAGVTHGELQWPTPVQFDSGEGIVGYGYEREVVFPVDFVVPAAVSSGEIQAKINWLGCSKDLCLPGRSTISLTVAQLNNPISPFDFSPWSAQLPESGGSSALQPSVENKGDGKFIVTLKLPEPAQKVEWFPVLGRDLKANAIEISSEGAVTKINFSLEQKDTSANLADLDSVLAYTLADGKRRAVELKIKLG